MGGEFTDRLVRYNAGAEAASEVARSRERARRAKEGGARGDVGLTVRSARYFGAQHHHVATGHFERRRRELRARSVTICMSASRKLPNTWEVIDAEMYAILAYLRKMASASDAQARRCLVLCDCKPALQIQNAHRKGMPARRTEGLGTGREAVS